MQSLVSPVTKALLVALFIFAILLILYVILWPIPDFLCCIDLLHDGPAMDALGPGVSDASAQGGPEG
ncbi:hypothetical protein ACRRTK_002866 [Alexandromys fortis]